jgi:hypothetical protein
LDLESQGVDVVGFVGLVFEFDGRDEFEGAANAFAGIDVRCSAFNKDGDMNLQDTHNENAGHGDFFLCGEA